MAAFPGLGGTFRRIATSGLATAGVLACTGSTEPTSPRSAEWAGVAEVGAERTSARIVAESLAAAPPAATERPGTGVAAPEWAGIPERAGAR
jgi:hypothetical protein